MYYENRRKRFLYGIMEYLKGLAKKLDFLVSGIQMVCLKYVQWLADQTTQADSHLKKFSNEFCIMGKP